MAEEQRKDQEKTEQPTPKRREEARKKGQVAKSQEVTSVTILLACLILFYFNAEIMVEKTMKMTRWVLSESGNFIIDSNTIHLLIKTLIYEIFGILAPLLSMVICVAVSVNVMQVGFLLSLESIQPKLSKIDPIKGFQRLFSMKALVELIKNVLKISVVGFIGYITIKGEMTNLISLGSLSTWGVLEYIGKVASKVTLRTCWVLIVLALFDYIFQKWDFEKNLKMSKQDVKDEFKQSEGDPLIRSRIKRLQIESARKRMMASVPKADVVITNPVHFAVALKYDQTTMIAPKVCAKGRGYIAEKIKDIAGKNNVPIIENKPLAQVLYKIVDVDETIPAELYKAVAEVLAYIYNIKSGK